MSYPHTENSYGQYRVLILEDNAFQREVLVAILNNLGIQHIVCAENGSEALDRIKEEPNGFHVVLCDLKMGDAHQTDGLEFIRMSSGLDIGSLIVVSGLEDDLCACAELLAIGCGAPLTGLIKKPVVIERVKHLLDKGASRTFQASSEGHPKKHRKWTKGDLEHALNKEQFFPYFQPKVSLLSGDMVGAEVLSRWEHPEYGIIMPDEFISVLESNGMIDRLTEQLYRRSLETLKFWDAHGFLTKIALNASPVTLEDINVPNRWRAVAREYGISNECITIEITETAATSNFHQFLETVTRLRINGFDVSLDDFGTGYSSLKLLNSMPISEIKIDRCFVNAAMGIDRSELILESVIAIAKKISVQVVAEGVETERDRKFIQKVGCEIGQGYLYAHPMSAADFLDWNTSRNRQSFH